MDLKAFLNFGQLIASSALTKTKEKQKYNQPEKYLIIYLQHVWGLDCASLQSSASPALFSKTLPTHA